MGEEIYPYKVLFVEDEEIIRENYTTYLKMLFKEVYEAKDGEIALKLYKEKKPDIIIIDIHLPKLNGIELLKKIRENDHSTKAIMLTAHTDKTFLLDAASLKLTKYLVKPISRKELKDALNESIEELNNYDILPIKKIKLKDNYIWNTELQELKNNSKLIELTSKEKKLLTILLSRKDKVFSYDEIFDYFWREEESFTLNSLKNLVKRLRKKLPENTIINQFNEGYKIKF
ncbi:response regulator transcription factor [Arcobacter sp. KX21116]|uniref:response regulator transcription factor n=1 Tax=Arcobacter iocasae TaxID=2906515 RepID=UPI0035D45396